MTQSCLVSSSSYPDGATAGSYIASVSSSYPAGAAAGSYIASVSSSSYPAGAAAGSYIASVSSSYTVAVCDCVFLLYDFFLLLLSTLQSLISPT